MNASTDILRGELERLFELEDMKHLSADLLGFDPESLGGATGKGAFARALVEHCADEDALEALADAILLTRKGREAGDSMRKVFDGGAGRELAPGTEIDGFRIMKKLGEGALGVVYLGERKRSETDKDRAALKVISRRHARDRAAVHRYMTVTRALMTTEAAGLAPILAVGELDDGRPWIATHFVEGQTLAARISRVGAMHFNEARPIVTSVLRTLATLHQRGIVHGDVKSENVFVVREAREDGSRAEPIGVLVDGGVDRLISRGAGLLSLSGTAKALDPQLAGGSAPTPQSDLYAAGALLYEVLAGRPPFVGSSALHVVAQHLIGQPEAPSAHAPRGWVSKELDAIALRALAKEPKDRFATVDSLVEALESLGRKATDDKPAAELDQAAFDRAAAALRDKPEDESLATALERVVEPARAWKKAVEVLLEVADRLEDVEAKKALLFRVARIEESDSKDHAAAEAAYRKVLELDATDDIAIIGIEELKRSAGAWDELIELLVDKAERETMPSERAAILREVAQISDEKLSSPENAFAAWVQALADEPSDERTVREIERLAKGSNERWNEAITSLSQAAQDPERPGDAARLYVLMGTWYGEHLSRPDFAIQCFGQALGIDPGNESAFEGTIKLYRKAQSWQELATLLLARADEAQSPAAARDHRAEAATVIHKKLNDDARAAELYREVLAQDPAHPKAADALQEILAAKGEWKELVGLLEKRATNEREADRLATLVQIGEIYEDRLGDAEKAQVHYESAIAHDPTNLPALKGLERLYAKSGKYKELLGVLERQVETAPTPRQKIGLYERIGSIREEEFVDHEQAIHAFEHIVAIEPGHEGANTALGRLYRQVQRFDDLATTLDRHAKGTEDVERKVSLLLACTKVLMVDLGAPERALSIVERVLSAAPEHHEGLDLMARLKASTGDAAAAIEAVDRLAEAEKAPARKCELWLRAGRLLEDKGDKDGAVQRYKRALDVHPSSTEAAVALRTIYASRGDAHGAVELIQREIDVTEGAIAKARLFAEMGELYRDRLEENDKAREAFEKAIELDATCTPAARGLSALAFEKQDYARAARFSEPLLARTSDMPVAVAREISLLCGDAYAQLADFSKAQRAYLNAKAFAPDDREILERVADVTFESGEPDEAAELYRDIYKRFGRELVGGDKGRILYRLGEASRRAETFDEAIPFLNEAAELLPEDPKPLTALARLYEAQGKWELVVRTHRRRMEHAGDEERYDLLVQVGDVLLEKMGDRQKASKSYVAALEIRADDRNLLTKLMAVYSESKDWSRLVEVILRIAELVDDTRQLSKYYNTAAVIAHRELGRIDEACEYYEQALENDPKLDQAFQGLVDCLSQKQDYDGLADAYRAHLRRMGETAPPEKRAAMWDALAEILHHRLESPADAVEAYGKAQELDPENRRRAEQLAEIYTSDPKRFFARAVETHNQLLHMSPYRLESYQALRRLYTDMKMPDESWCVCQSMTVLSMAEPDEEGFFKKHRSRTPAAAQEFLTEELWFNHLLHPDLDPLLTGIFAVITPAVSASRAQPLEAFGVTAADRRDAERDDAAIAQTLHYVSGVSQIELPPVYYRTNDPGGLSYLFTSPPGIGLGKGALAGGPSQALAFVGGRHLAYFRRGFYLRHLVPTGSGLRAWLLAAIKTTQPAFPVPADLAGPVSQHLEALQRGLTGQAQDELQSLVQKLLAASPALDMKRWVAAVDLTADRVGFVLANDLEIATAVLRASPEDSAGVGQKDRLRELHLYAVSQPYLQLRHKLGIAIGE